MAAKSQGSAGLDIVDDAEHAFYLGKIEQYRVLGSLYRKQKEELDKLTRNPSERGEPQSSMRRSLSLTQELLNEARFEQLEHPKEFCQIMAHEKCMEREMLQKKSSTVQHEVSRFQLERDELLQRILELRFEMKQRDGRIKQLEQIFHDTLSDADRCNCLEREQILRNMAELDLTSVAPTSSSSSSPTSSWMLVEGNLGKKVDPEVVELRRRIDELQQRITELLNHNKKWNALCDELQRELDTVRSQLQYYKRAEGSNRDELLADLSYQKQEKERAEKVSAEAKKRIEELETRVAQLEKQLEEKERLEKEKIEAMVAEEMREKIFLFNEQISIMKEDFEHEQREHKITRNQLDSMRKQWTDIYKELQDKKEQLRTMMLQLQAKRDENRQLDEQLAQADRDIESIREFREYHERTTGPAWECQSCTFLNSAVGHVCEMCGRSRNSGQRISSSQQPLPRETYDREPLRSKPKVGDLEEDGFLCCRLKKSTAKRQKILATQ